jgi:shikimate kinase
MTSRILLVGMMGAGKTTVGRLVAQERLWDYLDSDAQVEAETGMTVPEIYTAEGEEAFRAAESRVLERACASTGPCVVSVAGGAVLRPENRALIARSGTVVWLRAQVDTLARRVGDGSGRPLLDNDPLATLRQLDQVRRPLYAGLAHITIDVDDLEPSAVASQILESVAP